MIGELFTINATNIGRAALRAVPIALDSPVDARLVPATEPFDAQVAVLVSGEGSRQGIRISETRARACIHAEDLGETQDYVDELTAELGAAVREALR